VNGSDFVKRLGTALLIEILALPLLVVIVALLYALGLPGIEVVHAAIPLLLLWSLVLFLRKRRSTDATRAEDNG
jgi:heme A synthase